MHYEGRAESQEAQWPFRELDFIMRCWLSEDCAGDAGWWKSYALIVRGGTAAQVILHGIIHRYTRGPESI